MVEMDWSTVTDEEYLHLIFTQYQLPTGPLYWRGAPVFPGYSEGLPYETMTTGVIVGDSIDRPFIMILMELLYKTRIIIIKLNHRRQKIVNDWLTNKVQRIEPIGPSYVVAFVK